MVEKERQPLSILAAAAEPSDNTVGRWILANLDLKAALSLFAVAGSLFAMHTHTDTRLTTIELNQAALRDTVTKIGGLVAEQAKTLDSLPTLYVPRAEHQEKDLLRDQRDAYRDRQVDELQTSFNQYLMRHR